MLQRALRFAMVLAALLLLALSCSNDPAEPEQPGPETIEPGTITTWAGTGQSGWDGDGNPLRKSSFSWPIDVEFTPTLGVFFVDWNNHRIRRVESDGTLRTVIGDGFPGDGPPEGPNQGADTLQWWPALDCRLNHPTRVQETSDGMLLVTCWHGHKMRLLDLSSSMERVIIGRGAGCEGDGSA